MALPTTPPPLTPAGFDEWANAVTDTANEHDTAISTKARLLEGLLAARPAASGNSGNFYFATDEDGGTLYRSNGTDWNPVAPGVDVPAGTEVFHATLAASTSTFAAGTTSDIGLSGTIPADLGRPVMVEVWLSHVLFTSSGGSANVFITDSANAAVPGSGGIAVPTTTAASQYRTLVNRARLGSTFSGVVKARINPVSSSAQVVVSSGFTQAFMRAVTC